MALFIYIYFFKLLNLYSIHYLFYNTTDLLVGDLVTYTLPLVFGFIYLPFINVPFSYDYYEHGLFNVPDLYLRVLLASLTLYIGLGILRECNGGVG